MLCLYKRTRDKNTENIYARGDAKRSDYNTNRK